MMSEAKCQSVKKNQKFKKDIFSHTKETYIFTYQGAVMSQNSM